MGSGTAIGGQRDPTAASDTLATTTTAGSGDAVAGNTPSPSGFTIETGNWPLTSTWRAGATERHKRSHAPFGGAPVDGMVAAPYFSPVLLYATRVGRERR